MNWIEAGSDRAIVFGPVIWLAEETPAQWRDRIAAEMIEPVSDDHASGQSSR